MAMNVTPVGNNPSWPYQTSETYIPDQLIAGDLKLVTDTVTVGGAQVLRRGTVLGASSAGAMAASGGKTSATGTVAVAALPAPGDTLTVFGTVITFVASNPFGNQVQIGGAGLGGFPPATPTTAGTAQALLNFLVGSTDVNLVKATYSLAGSTITMTAAAIGSASNALTLATSNAAALTLSGATLAGGTANTGAETITGITSGPMVRPGNYVVTLTSATQANVEDPRGVFIGIATVGAAFTDPQINFTINTGAGIAAGDSFTIRAAPGSGAYVMSAPASTDGSAAPNCILADDVDPTGGAVLAPVYRMGEFNINAMTFGPGLSVQAAKDALGPLGIFLKTAVTAADPS